MLHTMVRTARSMLNWHLRFGHLDIMLPKMDGYEVAKWICQAFRHPHINVNSQVGIGGSYCWLECCRLLLDQALDTRELLACINALLRRQGAQVEEITFGNTTLDLSSAMLICGKNNIRLSAKEFDIIRLLFQAGEKILSKELLLTRVWGYDSDAVENHVEVYIGFLRKKLASIGSNVRIEANGRLGYHLAVCKDD